MLAARDLIVFLARPEALHDAAARAAALAILTDDERARLDRFRFDRDRDVALASRALQRRSLSWCAGDVAASAWRFAPDRDDRPQIVAPLPADSLSWNVANTIGLVACAVTSGGRAVGIDVEPRRADAPADVVDSHFAPAERAALQALPPVEQARRFVALWTLKEAYVKARSQGLSLPLSRFAFDPATDPPGFAIDPELGDDPSRWQVSQWWPTPEHCVAVCVDSPLSITVRWEESDDRPRP